MRHRSNSPIGNFIGGLIFGPLFVVIGIFVAFYIGKPTVDNAKASLDWPTVEGRITVSEVQRKRNKDKVSYAANVGYDYEVNGEQRMGDTVWFGGNFSSSSSGFAHKTVDRYPKGTQVKVYYDPKNPDRAVLEPGTFWSTYMVYGVGLLFFGVGLLVTGSIAMKVIVGIVAVGSVAGSHLMSGQDDQMKGFSSGSLDSSAPSSRDNQASRDNPGDDGFDIR